jgi:hypothetical protein
MLVLQRCIGTKDKAGRESFKKIGHYFGEFIDNLDLDKLE